MLTPDTDIEPNHAFHMVDREKLMDDGASPDTLNHTKLNSSLVDFLVVLHTQTDNCLTLVSCMRLINRMTEMVRTVFWTLHSLISAMTQKNMLFFLIGKCLI